MMLFFGQVVLPVSAGETAGEGSSGIEKVVTASLADSLARYLSELMDLPEWAAITLARLILVLAVLVAAWLVLRVVHYLIMGLGRKVLEARLGRESRGRAHTLVELFYSIAKYVVYFLAFITALYQADVNPAPFLGGAAVIGLAVGFGSQDLVKDVVTGIFILMENQFTIGEYVDLGGKAGVVTAMSVRVVTVRDDQGRLHNLPYRSITVVSNFSRSGAAVIADVFLAKSADEQRAASVLERTLAVLTDELRPIIDACKVEGVRNPGTPNAFVRARAACRPSRFEFVQGEIARRVKEEFAAESIEIKNGLIRFYTPPGETP